MTPKEHAFRLIEALDKARRSGKIVHEHELTEAAFEEAMAACVKIAEPQVQCGREIALDPYKPLRE